MPKSLFEIKSFNKGTLCNPDMADIPNEAAAHSVNIDAVSTNGKLKGRKIDVEKYNHDDADNMTADSMDYVPNKAEPTEKDLILYDYNRGVPKVKMFKDMDGVGTLSTLETNVGGTEDSSMVRNNQEVHIGTGGSATSASRWVGYINHEQFGYAVNDIYSTTAELSATAEFASMHKVVETTDFIYGIRYEGNLVYKWNKATKTMIYSNSAQEITKTTAICLGGGTPSDNHANDATHLWVWSQDGHEDANDHEHGIMFKVDLNLNILQRNQVAYSGSEFDPKKLIKSSSGSVGTAATNIPVMDMVETTNKIWLAFEKNNHLHYFNSESYPLLAVPISTFDVAGATWDLEVLKATSNANPLYKDCKVGGVSASELRTIGETAGALKGYYAITTLSGDAGSSYLSANPTPAVLTPSSQGLSLMNASGSDTQICYFVNDLTAGRNNEGTSGTSANQIVNHNEWDGEDDHDWFVTMFQGMASPHVFIIDESWIAHRISSDAPDPDKCWAVTTGTSDRTDEAIFRKNDTMLYRCSYGLHSSLHYGVGNSTHYLKSITQNKKHCWISYVGDMTGLSASSNNDLTGASNWRQNAGMRIVQMPSITKISDYNDKTAGSSYHDDKLSEIEGGTSLNDDLFSSWVNWFLHDSSGVYGDIANYNSYGWYNTVFGLYMDQVSRDGEDDTHLYDEDEFAFSPGFVNNIRDHFRKVAIRIAADESASINVGQGSQGGITDGNTYENYLEVPVICTAGNGVGDGTLNMFEGAVGDVIGIWASFPSIPANNVAFNVHTPGATNAPSSGYYMDRYYLVPTQVAKPDIVITAITHTTEDNGFTNNNSFQWATSYEYDGYQEGPIHLGSVTKNATNTKDWAVSLTLNNLDADGKHLSTNKRISAVNLYRRERPTSSPDDDYSLFRLVERLPLDNSWTYETSAGWLPYRKKTVYDKYVVGATYDTNAGLSQEIKNSNANYAVSCKLFNHHFVANCYHNQVGHYPTYLWKSLPLKFDMFDAALDFLALPDIPTALAAFAGRIYAFSETTTWKVDPSQLVIEDEFLGIGCTSQQSFCVTEYGMLFANKQNIYLHDGQKPIPLGYPIMHSEYKDEYGYQEMVMDASITSTGIAAANSGASDYTNTFTISGGFFEAGFKVGDHVEVSGFTQAENNHTFIISQLTDTVMTTRNTNTSGATGATVTEGAGDTVTIKKVNNQPICTFNSKDLSFVVAVGAYSWCYNIPAKRWDMWHTPLYTSNYGTNSWPCYGIKSSLISHDGKMLFSIGQNTTSVASEATPDSDAQVRLCHYSGDKYNESKWTWVSKALNLGEAGRVKKFIEVKAQFSGKTPDNINNDEMLRYGVDVTDGYGESNNGTAAIDTTYRDHLETPINTKGTALTIKLDDVDSAVGPKMEIDYVSVVYRPTNRIS